MSGWMRDRLGSAGFSSKPTMRQSLSVSMTPKLPAASCGIHFDGGDGDVGAGIDVLLEHFLVIHFVDVIAGKDEDEIGLLAADGIDVLIDGVGGALIPVLGDAHLRREHFDEIAVAHEQRPAAAHVAIEAEGFVLGKNEDAAQLAIQAIGERDVNDAVDAAEGDGRLGAIASERPKAFALATGQQDRKCVAHQWHGHAPPESPGQAEDILAASASGLKERATKWHRLGDMQSGRRRRMLRARED